MIDRIYACKWLARFLTKIGFLPGKYRTGVITSPLYDPREVLDYARRHGITRDLIHDFAEVQIERIESLSMYNDPTLLMLIGIRLNWLILGRQYAEQKLLEISEEYAREHGFAP